MTDFLEYAILGFVLVDTLLWALTLSGVKAIQKAVGPVLARVMPFVAALPTAPSPTAVPPGALGLPLSAAPTAPAQTAAPEVRLTKKGQPFYIDPVTRLAKFLPKGATTAPPVSVPRAASGGVDLNALARQYGFDPSDVAAKVAEFTGGAPPSEGEAFASSALPGVPSAVSDQIIASLAQRFIKGELKPEDVAQYLPQIFQFLRGGGRRAPNAPAVDSASRW